MERLRHAPLKHRSWLERLRHAPLKHRSQMHLPRQQAHASMSKNERARSAATHGGGEGGEGDSGGCDNQQSAQQYEQQQQQQREWHAHGGRLTARKAFRTSPGLGDARMHAAKRVCGPQPEWSVPTCGLIGRTASRLRILCARQLKRPMRHRARSASITLRSVPHAGDRDDAPRERGRGACGLRTRALRAWPRPRSPGHRLVHLKHAARLNEPSPVSPPTPHSSIFGEMMCALERDVDTTADSEWWRTIASAASSTSCDRLRVRRRLASLIPPRRARPAMLCNTSRCACVCAQTFLTEALSHQQA